MADCIDWQIIERLTTLLGSITKENGYETQVNTVDLIRAQIDFNREFPLLIVAPNETDPYSEYMSRHDILPFVLIYCDGEIETDTSYIYRYRNVAADIQKCLQTDVQMGGLCQYVSVKNYGYDLIELEQLTLPVCYCYVEVERLVNNYDPYIL